MIITLNLKKKKIIAGHTWFGVFCFPWVEKTTETESKESNGPAGTGGKMQEDGDSGENAERKKVCEGF